MPLSNFLEELMTVDHASMIGAIYSDPAIEDGWVAPYATSLALVPAITLRSGHTMN